MAALGSPFLFDNVQSPVKMALQELVGRMNIAAPTPRQRHPADGGTFLRRRSFRKW